MPQLLATAIFHTDTPTFLAASSLIKSHRCCRHPVHAAVVHHLLQLEEGIYTAALRKVVKLGYAPGVLCLLRRHPGLYEDAVCKALGFSQVGPVSRPALLVDCLTIPYYTLLYLIIPCYTLLYEPAVGPSSNHHQGQGERKASGVWVSAIRTPVY